jgi:acyl-CoA synthetase (AMP-forming)/AMP-acid ligase II
MLVQDFLENSADRLSGKVGMICDGHRLTYAEIESRANHLANALKAHGVGRGERVVVYLHNTVELVISIFATLKAGGVFVVVNHSTKHGKLAYIMNNCQARALITSGRQADMARQYRCRAAAGSCHPDPSKVPLGQALFDVWPDRD